MNTEAKLKALVVEDEALVAMLIEDILADMGHEVAAVAGRLEQALTLIQTADFDFAVLDLNLNGVRTYPVAEALVSRGKPFMFATGYGSAGLDDPWRRYPVVQKPFTPEDLARAIEQAMTPRA